MTPSTTLLFFKKREGMHAKTQNYVSLFFLEARVWLSTNAVSNAHAHIY